MEAVEEELLLFGSSFRLSFDDDNIFFSSATSEEEGGGANSTNRFSANGLTGEVGAGAVVARADRISGDG